MLSNALNNLRKPVYWLLGLGLLLYALLFAEIFVRIFTPTIMTPRYVVDSGYGVRGNWPGMEYSHYSGEYGEVPFKINSHGQRSDVEIDYAKPPGTLRIMAFGDSFTVGYGATNEQTYLSQMRDALQSTTNCQVQAINMGVSGHGGAEELIAFERKGYQFAPDVVVFQWHRTDLKDNIRSRLFRLVDGELKVDNETFLPLVGVREKLFANPAYRALAANSMAYTWVRNSLARLTKKSLWRSGIQAAETIDNADERWEELGEERIDFGAGTLIEQDLAVAILKRARAKAHELGAQFLILDVPRRVDRTTFRSTFPRRSGLEQELYNPIPDFALHAGQLLYWEHSAGHFSVLGNQVVGQGLADRVVLPDCSGAGS